MKKGFTLIELLAVIVILAIIALIATPIILGIINDAREESNERSVELYASAVRNGIAAYQLREGKEVLPGTYNETNKLPFEVEYDGKVDCENIIISETGKVSLEGCTVNNGTKKYSYGIEEETPVAKVCTIERQDASKYSVGDVVTCELSESTDKFYVIEETELTASTLQMLTEKNIHTTEYRQSENAGYTAFSSTNYWSNITNYPTSVYDERNDLIKPIVNQYVNYLNVTLNQSTGSLITLAQAENLGCIAANGACATDVNGGGTASPWVYSTSYWIGASKTSNVVWVVYNDPGAFDVIEYNEPYFGVRPVIVLSTSNLIN